MVSGSVDVVVIGSGVAGLASAISAKEAGADVLVLEKAPRSCRGGNGWFTEGTIRFAYDEGLHGFPAYPVADLYADMMRESKGKSDPRLLGVLASESLEAILWLEDLGVERLAPENWPYDMKTVGVYHFIAKGQGRGLVDSMLLAARKRGVKVLFNNRVAKLLVDAEGHVSGVTVFRKRRRITIACGAVVLACGGFESSRSMRVKYIGRSAADLIVRGTKYDTGDGLRMAMELGAVPYGDWSDFHSGVSDARAPKFGGGLFQIAGFPFTIMVNRLGKRFLDEGEDFYDLTYVKTGKELLRQPGRIGYCIFDAKVKDYVTSSSSYGPFRAQSLDELASRCKLPPKTLRETVQAFNRAVAEGVFNPQKLDGKVAKGIMPPKSNWAMTIDTPPFFAYPVTGSITFTFGGLKIDEEARVERGDGSKIPGLYAVGEITGGFFYHNYVGSTGIPRNLVFGRRAGRNAAADDVRRRKMHATRGR